MAAFKYLLSPLSRLPVRFSRATVQPECRSRLLYYSRSISCSPIAYHPVIPFNLPDVGEAIMTVTVTEWLVKPGDKVSMGDAICEVQSDKSSATIYCPFDGVVDKLMYEVDDTAHKDKPLIMIDVEGGVAGEQTTTTTTTEVEKDKQPTSSDNTVSSETVAQAGKVLATPAVRKIAQENNIDLSTVTGTGKDGRVLKEDLLKHLEAPPTRVIDPPQPRVDAIKPPPTTAGDHVEPIKGFKAVMVQTMSRSGQIPQFGYCDEIEMDQLIGVRNVIKDSLTRNNEDTKLSYMPLVIKAISLALRDFPILNAHVNPECTEITYKKDHNIGVAVDTPLGLVVPNIKQVQNKSVLDIAREMNQIHDRSLKGELSPSEIVGGTFSLSNIGAVGGTYTRPMLLPPEVCIGAFGKIQEIAKFNSDNSIRRSHVMNVSWSADHRVIDGATVARFSNQWKSFIENPSLMLTELK